MRCEADGRSSFCGVKTDFGPSLSVTDMEEIDEEVARDFGRPIPGTVTDEPEETISVSCIVKTS